VVGVSDESVLRQNSAMSKSFSANLSAYSDMPSFQSAIYCIAATKVRSWLSFGSRQQRVYTGKYAIARLSKARGSARSMSVDMFRPGALGFSCGPRCKDAAPVVSADRDLSIDAETERSPIGALKTVPR
jgi:hypothetical protein